MLFAHRLLFVLRRHWPHYVAEALGLAFFVGGAGLLTILMEHPASPVRQSLAEYPVLRRGISGLGLGLVLAIIVYSPWGKRSGAHINPAVTLAFWQLGKIRFPDAVWYVLAQLGGAIGAAQLLKLCLPKLYAHPAVKYTVTQPNPVFLQGELIAFVAEFIICFVMMLVALIALHSSQLKEWVGWLLGALVAIYVLVETPYSGMSLNPARSLGTALAAGSYHGLWLYWVAPCLAMWLATVGFLRFHHGQPLECAILAGCGPSSNSPHASDEEPPQYPDE
ncbi:major intrinsic protein [Hymenobacter roseosalivarius DSM 11622]|uniref:Major intrinsic protein n=1 Tax=Hymenobacter roseosalivarius DSM 11622 TaxID=645990 RepID=A0A1W1VYC7_9BACT|nr:aquaporin [Hymenobacter roseosalivarius]SMB98358.1 major intrinsic protein [Hymenobacter roseosalivarius DSM 11622]